MEGERIDEGVAGTRADQAEFERIRPNSSGSGQAGHAPRPEP
jgi:hypothetical protein